MGSHIFKSPGLSLLTEAAPGQRPGPSPQGQWPRPSARPKAEELESQRRQTAMRVAGKKPHEWLQGVQGRGHLQTPRQRSSADLITQQPGALVRAFLKMLLEQRDQFGCETGDVFCARPTTGTRHPLPDGGSRFPQE